MSTSTETRETLHSDDPRLGLVAKIMALCARNTALVLIFSLMILVGGLWSLDKMPLDAIPDLTDTQVIIETDFPGQAPQIVEDLVTYPLSTALLGLPHAKAVRGFSMFGNSFVYIIFEEGVELYWARTRVLEALSKAQALLPAGAIPKLGPDATGLGWIYQYVLVDDTKKHDLAQLRSLQDWFLKFELASVPGVAEVASMGGFVKEYQVLVDPDRLRAYNLSLGQVMAALKGASQETGGGVLERGGNEFVVRAKGYLTTVEDIKKVLVYAKKETPVLVEDVARVLEGPALRRGVVDFQGQGDHVGGIIVMRSGENALNVLERVTQKLETLKAGLPKGVRLVPVYDRAPLIRGAVAYLMHKLLEEGFVVALVCFVFLLHVRASFVAIVTLPLGILASFMVMSAQGITANIMSLGGIAIAIGAMVDASVVIVENAHRTASSLPKDASVSLRRSALLSACQEVGPGLFFSLLVITVSFLPVFALTGASYRLFSPLAFTKTYAMAFASLLSITLVPVLVPFFLKGRMRREEENPLNRFFIFLYKPLLSWTLDHKKTVLGMAIVLLGSSAWPLMRSGSEFMPALYEGDLLYMPTTLPSVSLAQASDIVTRTNALLRQVPEVEMVFGKAGRAQSATDPAPLSMIETWIRLKPKEAWREGLTPEALIKELDERVKLPGLVNSWGYPIRIRMDMVSTGLRTPVGIKVSGNNLKEIERLSAQIEGALKSLPGTRSVFADRVLGGKYWEVTPNRDRLARHGIDFAVFQESVAAALKGMAVTQSIQGRERYDIVVTYDRPFRERALDLENILIATSSGQSVPLAEVAQVDFVEGPSMVRSENARLTGWVLVDVAGRDLGSYFKDAREHLEKHVPMPTGYSLTWAGQFEDMQKAQTRLSMAIPGTLLIILTLLLMYFGRMDRTLMVMASLPFGLVGGLWSVYLAGYHFSVAVAVGFIALAGIAVETCVVMLLYLDQQERASPATDEVSLKHNIMTGAALRVRPKLMTVSVIILGLAPIFLTQGLGSDVMRRVALPMIGGMVSTTLLTLLVIPVIYGAWARRRL